MSHLVIFTGLDGTVGYMPSNTLAEAVGHVEALRNDKGIDGSKIFKLEEIKFDVRPYYRVEIAGAVLADTTVPAKAEEPRTEVYVEVRSEAVAAVDAPAAAISSITSEVASLIAPPPPPPPAPAPIAPSAIEDGDLDDAALGNRRGLFGR